MQQTMDGLVLRSHANGADRILTILTGEQGIVTAFANKTGTMKSKLAASTEALTYSRFVLFTSRGRTVVDKADSNRIFFGLREDWGKLCLASYFSQLASELCPQNEPAGDSLRLMLNTLDYLEKEKRDQRQLKALFELRLMTLSGFMPDLVGCSVCGNYEHEVMEFFPADGVLMCGDCLGHGDNRWNMGEPVRPGVLAAMRHVIYAPFEKLFSFTLGDEGLDSLYKISESYLLAQVERGFSALTLYRECRFAGSDQTETEPKL